MPTVSYVTPQTRNILASLASLLIYLALSVLFFGRSLAGHLSNFHVGTGTDPSVMMWMLAWWSHAIGRRLNVFVTHAIWAPSGFNLAWATCIPLAAWVSIPLTRIFGPVVSYNLLCLIAPALASWTAFILCRYVTKSFWPSLLGGYIFGFSSYMLGQMFGNLAHLLVFPVPLVVYLVVRKLAGEIRTASFAMLLALVLVAQFLLTIEIVATMTMFGAMAIALAISFTSGDVRSRVLRLIAPILAGYAIAVVLLSPYLYYLFAFSFPHQPMWSLAAFSGDLLNFVIPTRLNVLGRVGAFESISNRFLGNAYEAGGYLGLPLILIAAIFARYRWREPLGKLLIDSLIIICVLSLGPLLHLAGKPTIGLPGKLLARLPILDNALPARFMLYAFLDLAILTSIWLATSSTKSASKYAISVLAVLFLTPNLSAGFWIAPVDTPAFFLDGTYRTYLAPDETVVILPYGFRGNSLLWQAGTDMYFRMAGGYTGIVPPEFECWPIVDAIYAGVYLPDADLQLKAFLANHDVSAVIVSDPEEDAWRPLLSTFGVTPVDVGGVSLYKIPPLLLAAYKGQTPLDLERQADSTRFDTLVVAANKYLERTGALAGLTPPVAYRLGLLPADWLVGPPVPPYYFSQGSELRLDKGLWIGPWINGEASVGVEGSYDAIRPLIDKYRGSASQIFFPYPEQLSGTSEKAGGSALLVMVFDRVQLSRAAARIEALSSRPAVDPRLGRSLLPEHDCPTPRPPRIATTPSTPPDAITHSSLST